MITVFYDGKCGLCAKEIQHYRQISPEGIFDWQDITQSDTDLKKEGITLSQGLKFLHARDDNGQMHVGVDAFILIWQNLRYWKGLAMLVALPGIKHMAQALYKHFAKWRFGRLDHCQLAASQEPPV